MSTTQRTTVILGLALLFAAGALAACELNKNYTSCQEPQALCGPAHCSDHVDCIDESFWCLDGVCTYGRCSTTADCQKFQEGLVCDTEKNLCYDPSDGDAEAETTE